MKKLLYLFIVLSLWVNGGAALPEETRLMITNSKSSATSWENKDFKKRVQQVIGRGYLYSIDISGDGEKMLVTSSFGLEIYNKNLRLLKRIYSSDLLADARFSPDGKSVLSVSRSSVKIWDIARGESKELVESMMIPRQISVDSKGDYLAISGYRFGVTLIHKASGYSQTVLKHKNFVSAIAFHPTEPVLVSGSRDKTVRLHNVKTHREKIYLRVKDDVSTLCFSPDGKFLFVATDGRGLDIVNYQTGNYKSYKLRLAPLQAMAVSADNRYLAALTRENSLVIMDIKVNKVMKTIKPGIKLPSRFLSNDCLKFSRDNKKLWYINEKNQLARLSVPDGKLEYAMDYPAFSSFSMSGKDDELVVSSGSLTESGSYHVSLPDSGVKKLNPGFNVSQAYFNPDGNTYLLGGEGELALYSAKSHRLMKRWKDSRIGKVLSISVPKGKGIGAISTSNNNVILLNLYKGTIEKVIELVHPALTVAFNHSGKYLVIAHTDVVLYDTENETTRTLYSYIGGTNTMAASPIRNWLALGSLRKMMYIVDIDSPKVNSRWKGSYGKTPVAFSSDGRFVAFGGYKSVGVWDMYNNNILELGGYKQFVESVAFSSDGKSVYSLGREDGLIVVTKFM